MSLHFESVGSYFTQPWDAVADVLYLHVGYLSAAKILSRMFLALYRSAAGYAGGCYNPSPIMSTIALYQLLRRIPDVTEDEAQAAADSIAHVDEVATKTDLLKLKTELKDEMHILETKLIKLILGSAGFVVIAVSTIVKPT